MSKPLKSGWAIVNGRGRVLIDAYGDMPLLETKRDALRYCRPDERPVRVDVVVRTQTKRKKR